MGMYDQLNNITRAINETQKKEEIKTAKTTIEQLIKYNIIAELQSQLLEAEAMGFNLYHETTKDRIITNILNLIKSKEHPEFKFLHNEEYTIFFINDNYYKQISKIDKIEKGIEKPKKEFEKQLKQQEKEKIKQEKEQLKIKQKAQQQQKANKLQTLKNINKSIAIITLIILSPLIIIGEFLLACAKNVK